MYRRTRAALSAALSTLALAALAAPAAQANALSLLPGSCGNQPQSQPFAQWGDQSEYTPAPGGSFESGNASWQLSGGAAVTSGNETFYVNSKTDSHSLSLPAGSSAVSPAACTNIARPTARLFVRNTGSASSRLTVQALYPALVGGTATTTIGVLTGTSNWEPSPTLSLATANLLATLSLQSTTIAFEFTPSGAGNWNIDDVYIDPYARG
jgi:hypothetical protein